MGQLYEYLYIYYINKSPDYEKRSFEKNRKFPVNMRDEGKTFALNLS